MRAALGGISVVLYAVCACAQPGNLLPNGSFELVEPAAPTAATITGARPSAPEDFLPRTWHCWAQSGATAKLPEDPAQAHSGNRCVQFKADKGQAFLRYWPLPVAGGKPWTVELWARGAGRLALTALDMTTDTWQEAPVQVFDLRAEWTQFTALWRPPESCRKWVLNLTNHGPAQCFIDDVSATRDGAQAPPWPPQGPLGHDEQTLLLLDFDKPLDPDAFYVGGQIKQVEGKPSFGQALQLGPEGYVACSADENLDPRCGTIEVWCKLLAPGGNGIQQPFVSIPGMEGMWLGKDQYSHVGFGFSSGWAPLSQATMLGYAGNWQPCWRHVAACWDADALQLFVDGKLIAWQTKPTLSRFLGPELRLGSPGMVIDDLRISRTVRYRVET